MRFATIMFCLFAAGGVSAAAPADQKPSESHHTTDIVTSVGRGRLGIAAIAISPDLRVHLNAPRDRGVLVDNVLADAPAGRAGIQVGDVVTSVDGAPARSARDVIDALSGHKKGDTVAIDVVRDGKSVRLQATLDRDPGPALNSSRDFDAPMFRDFSSDEMQQQLDRMHQQIERLEQRMHKLEHT